MFTTKKISVTLCQTFQKVTEEQNVDDKNCNVGTHFTNVCCNLFQFMLEWCDFGSNNQLFDDLADARILTNHKTDHFAFTTSDTGA
jgi:hypothetical protein